MISRNVKTLFASSLMLLLFALACWYFAPAAPKPEGETAALKVGAHEAWMIAMGISIVLGLAIGLAGLKLWVNDRSERQIAQSLLN